MKLTEFKNVLPALMHFDKIEIETILDAGEFLSLYHKTTLDKRTIQRNEDGFFNLTDLDYKEEYEDEDGKYTETLSLLDFFVASIAFDGKTPRVILAMAY